MEELRVKAVVCDWAGTMIDYGSRAVLGVFLETFKAKGIPVTPEEAIQSMGKKKIDHIRDLLHIARVTEAYQAKFGSAPTEETAQEFYKTFESLVYQVLAANTQEIPGAFETAKLLKQQGIKIGSCSGYIRDMMNVILPIVKANGYSPDCVVTSDEVPQGRPAPWMMYKNAQQLNVYPMCSIVKVGDTIADIEEGRNAQAWTVGIIIGSSMLGLTETEIKGVKESELKAKIGQVRKRFEAAGSDFVLESIQELPALIQEINKKLSKGERPGDQFIFPQQSYTLFTPGPLTTSRTVKYTMLTDWGSREQNYVDLVRTVRTKLCKLATSKPEDYTAVIMQGSGTFGVEACITSVLPPNGKLLVISNGAYGKRMFKIAKILKINAIELEFQEDQVPDLQQVETLLGTDSEITHVGYIHSETTTGLLNPIDTIQGLIKKYKKISIVDAMSSFGGVQIDMAALDIDFLISGSNKNIQGVPGFSFVIGKKGALNACKGFSRSLCLDIVDQCAALDSAKGEFRFSSPVHVIRAFEQALRELEDEGGVPARHKRYSEMQSRLAEGMQELGFKVMDLHGHQGPIITTFLSPKCPKYDFERFYNALKERKCVIYPGKLTKADSFRIGTIGDITMQDIENVLLQIKECIFWDNT